MEELKLIVKRAANSAAGNPRFEIIGWSSQILFDRVIKNGFIKRLKNGFFTRPNDGDNYSIGNKEGIIIDNILIVSTIKY